MKGVAGSAVAGTKFFIEKKVARYSAYLGGAIDIIRSSVEQAESMTALAGVLVKQVLYFFAHLNSSLVQDVSYLQSGTAPWWDFALTTWGIYAKLFLIVVLIGFGTFVTKQWLREEEGRPDWPIHLMMIPVIGVAMFLGEVLYAVASNGAFGTGEVVYPLEGVFTVFWNVPDLYVKPVVLKLMEFPVIGEKLEGFVSEVPL